MSEVYNPETKMIEQLEHLTRDARELAVKRDHAQGEDRLIIERQLHETENRVAMLQRRLRR